MNDSVSPSQPTEDRRLCDRFIHSRKIVLTLENGQELQGETKDISLGGILMKTTLKTDEDITGKKASLYLVLKESELSNGFNCRVMRISDNYLGLELERKSAASFGKALTRGLFVRKTDKNQL
ncbi:MAG: PilZ domain-containing protein [Gammaproteobacteria bacterium]|nr:PilZ domain-containing protein [Gammaproteobacteria bacterium]